MSLRILEILSFIIIFLYLHVIQIDYGVLGFWGFGVLGLGFRV